MATKTLPADETKLAAAEFLTLQGRYTIDPANTSDQLLEDAYGLLIGGLATLDALWESLDSGPNANAIWCAINALKQARACMGKALAPIAGVKS